MPSSTKLTDLLAEMRDLVAIERGLVSPRDLANRAFVVAPGFVVARGYLRDKIPEDVAEAAWVEHLDSPEFLDWYSRFVPPPPPPPESRPEPELPEPERESPSPGNLFQAMRRRLQR